MPFHRELTNYYIVGNWGVGAIILTDESKSWYVYNVHEPDDRIKANDLHAAMKIADCLHEHAA